ncbi:MAG TPA: DUF503 domain-containing protein [Planctomycetota bacterium]|nr:DUF503 domain-containing protein [Planctomycetota bacterium]
MNVAVLQFRLRIDGCGSLKEKRRIVKSLKDRARQRFNVSIAEVDDHDIWGSAVLGASSVGVDAGSAEGSLRALLKFVEAYRDASLEDHQLEIL